MISIILIILLLLLLLLIIIMIMMIIMIMIITLITPRDPPLYYMNLSIADMCLRPGGPPRALRAVGLNFKIASIVIAVEIANT